MTKRKKIIYWIATVWLAFGMLTSGIVQLFALYSETDAIIDLGYPAYFLKILAVWKFLGVVAVLIPKNPLVKEWAYAGFFFAMSGAVLSHMVTRHPITEILPALFTLILVVVSWYFRPTERKFGLHMVSGMNK